VASRGAARRGVRAEGCREVPGVARSGEVRPVEAKPHEAWPSVAWRSEVRQVQATREAMPGNNRIHPCKRCQENRQNRKHVHLAAQVRSANGLCGIFKFSEMLGWPTYISRLRVNLHCQPRFCQMKIRNIRRFPFVLTHANLGIYFHKSVDSLSVYMGIDQ
jgi:hypothetical protein